jgi:molecular chaperone HscB
MMDINENMMELEFNNDAVRFELIRRAVDHFRQELDVGIQPVVETWTEADGVEALTAVRDYFLKKRYLLRIQENLSTFAPHQD